MPPPMTSTRGRRVSAIVLLANSAFPAKAGTHPSPAPARDWRTPAFAGNAVSTVASLDGSGFSRGPPASAEKQQGRLFEVALDPLDELGRLPAIDDAVIEGGGQVHHLAAHDLAVTYHG